MLTAAEAEEMARRLLAIEVQEPVAWTDAQELRDVEKHGCGYLFTVNPIMPNADPRRIIKLYAAPQPVAVLDEDALKKQLQMIWWSGGDCHYMSDETASKIIAACRAGMLSAAHVNPEFTTHLVGEVVAWNHPNHERNVDFHWLDFDVEPGTKLYAIKQERG